VLVELRSRFDRGVSFEKFFMRGIWVLLHSMTLITQKTLFFLDGRFECVRDLMF
jgi:hypothetical protein